MNYPSNNLTGQPIASAQETEAPVTIGPEAYISRDYAAAERDLVWRKTWLQAGRVEDIPEIGNYITYDVLDDSILIVRTAEGSGRTRSRRSTMSAPIAAAGWSIRRPASAMRAAGRCASSAASIAGRSITRANAPTSPTGICGRAR